MTTVIDTNVLIARRDAYHTLSAAAQAGLDAAFRRGLVNPGPVYAELRAKPVSI
jgi:hypothetical protein